MTDENLEITANNYEAIGAHQTAAALRELRDLRAARAASRERVVAVVRDAVHVVLWEAHVGCIGDSVIHGDAIATRVADALAAPQPALTGPEVTEVSMACALLQRRHPRASAAIGKLMASAQVVTPQPALDAARVRDVVRDVVRDAALSVLGGWPRSQPDAASKRNAAAIAARVAEQLAGQAVALSAEERDILRWVREEAVLYLGQSFGITKGDLAKRAIVFVDRLLSAPSQVASPASGSGSDPQPWPHRYDRDATDGIGQCRVCGSDDEGDGSHVQDPPPTLDAATCRRLASEAAEDDAQMTRDWYVDGQRVRSREPGKHLHYTTTPIVVSDGPDYGGNLQRIARTRNNLTEVSRHLTAAAELAENYLALQHRLEHACKLAGLWTGPAGENCQTCGGNLYDHVGSDLRCPNRLAAAELVEEVAISNTERDAARAECADARKDVLQLTKECGEAELARDKAQLARGKMQDDRDAAQAEATALRKRVASLECANAELQRTNQEWRASSDAAQAECERLRGTLHEIRRDLIGIINSTQINLIRANMLTKIEDALDQQPQHSGRRETASLREWLASWGNGPNWADPTGATVPIAKTALRELLDANDAAKAECDRWRAMDQKTEALAEGRLLEITELLAECERLRVDLETSGNTIVDYTAGRGWQRATRRALLATEPAVSEERCSGVELSHMSMSSDPSWRGRAENANSLADQIPSLLAAARQLHALRAGMREIVGGEPAALTSAQKVELLAWAVTPERVGALRWVRDLLTSPSRSLAPPSAVHEITAMLAEATQSYIEPPMNEHDLDAHGGRYVEHADDLRPALKRLLADDPTSGDLRRRLQELIK